MANFCSNCGAKLKAEAKFCSNCGTSQAVAESNNFAGYWDAKEVSTGDDYASNIKGSLSLTKDEIIFYRNKFLSGKTKEWRRIPIRGIKSIYRTPIFNMVNIKYNRKPEKTGFFSRIFNARSVSYKISNWQTFLQNVQRLNRNIKIKA